MDDLFNRWSDNARWSWGAAGGEQPPELDPSQDGNEGETDFTALHIRTDQGQRGHPTPIDLQRLLQTSPDMYSGTDDGSRWGGFPTDSLTGPRRLIDLEMMLLSPPSSSTLPLASDLDDLWPQQFPWDDTSLVDPWSKNTTLSGTFIVDDYGDGGGGPFPDRSQTWLSQWSDSPINGLGLETVSPDEYETGPMLESAGSGSGSPDDISAFADRQVKEEDDSPPMEWSHSHSPSVESSPDRHRPWEGVSLSFPPRRPTRPRRSGPPGRKRRSKNTGSDEMHSHPPAHWPKPLRIVHEDGRGGSISSEDVLHQPRGARRKGPLTTVGRANAGLRRKNKDTCVQCRLNKRKCTGDSPCDACFPTLQEQPCARACFANIVEYGTCNYISQRAINHPTISGSGRVRMEIPSAFKLNDLLLLLNERRGRFNIRACQSWGSLYVLDLAETHKFLKALSESSGYSQFTFLEFIDHRIIESKDKSKPWLDCVKGCNPMNNAYALLSKWNNMPSRAAYSYVFLDDARPEQQMDVTQPEDRNEILLAAQLSRIFCRLLEVEGFRKLERDFYNIKWKRISLDTHKQFLGELGDILLSLRWRVSWWKLLGDGGMDPDPSQQHYVERVELLCRILYVYYTNVRAKLPSWSTAQIPDGIWSTYADAERPVWDDFPLDATENGFFRWMERGRALIGEAGVPSRVSGHITKV